MSTVLKARSKASILCLACLLLSIGCDRGQHPHALGKVAPPFTITDGTQTVRLDQYRGQVVLLTFWASWCAPCVEELPSLLALHRRLPQLVILGISIDSDPDAYRSFLDANRIDFPTVREPSQATMHLYGTVQIPESYIIDRSGHIIRKYISAQDWTNPEVVATLASALHAGQ